MEIWESLAFGCIEPLNVTKISERDKMEKHRPRTRDRLSFRV